MPSAAGQLLAAFQHDHIFTAVDRNQLFDVLHIHNGRAVDANEVIRIQSFQGPRDRPAKHVPFARRLVGVSVAIYKSIPHVILEADIAESFAPLPTPPAHLRSVTGRV
jgi:hypothetical protein